MSLCHFGTAKKQMLRIICERDLLGEMPRKNRNQGSGSKQESSNPRAGLRKS